MTLREGESYLGEFIRVLPLDGNWKFDGQRECWLHALELALDLVLDYRRQNAQQRWLAEQVELAEIQDVGQKGVIIL